jgi:glycine/D-amino acid oxidase-like deaminating enzyme
VSGYGIKLGPATGLSAADAANDEPPEPHTQKIHAKRLFLFMQF